MRKSKITLSAVACLLAVVAVVPAVRSQEPAPAAEKRHEVVPRLPEVFAGLADAPAPDPASPAAQELVRLLATQGEDAPSAVPVHTQGRGGARMNIAVGRRVVCASVEGPTSRSSGCAPGASAADPATPLMLVDYLGGDSYRVSGLLVSGSGDVRVVGESEKVTKVDTVRNVFSVVLAEQPAQIRWTAPNGQPHQQTIRG